MSADREHAAPPVGEEVHLPGPSLLPIWNALGITLGVIGITLAPIISVVGVVIFVISTGLWIRDARREFDELPPDHLH
jgi:uncharacterized membrane protein (DUF485 family)